MIKADKYLVKTLKELIASKCEDSDVRAKYRDGKPAITKFLTHKVFKYDLSKGELPIPTLRSTAIKTGIGEIFTIFRDQLNTQVGFEKNSTFWWQDWMNAEGNLGKAYSYNLESHRNIDTVKQIVQVDKRLVDIADTQMEKVTIGPPMKSVDGKVYFDRYIVVKDFDEKDRKYCHIQFVETGNVIKLRRDLIGNSRSKDRYERTTYNVGYLGDYESVLNMSDLAVSALKDKWENMFRRCYSENYEHKKLYENTFVHKRWHSFENFLRDARYLPHYHLAKEVDFKDYDLDKDYYNSNVYSKDTCVFLDSKENKAYARNKPFLYKGVTYLTQDKFANDLYSIQSTVSKALIKGVFRREPISFLPVSEKLYRYELSRNQINDLLEGLLNNKYSRRHILSLWNWANIDKKELVECAFLSMFSVRNIGGTNYLDLTLTLRSSDYITAGFINQIQYVALLMMIVNHLNFYSEEVWAVGKFMCVVNNLHIYKRHIVAAEEVLGREPIGFQPTLGLSCPPKDFYDHTIGDFDLDLPKGIEPLSSKLELAI